MLACLLACRGPVEGLGLLSGLVSAIRRAEVLRHAGQYRELSTPVGTAGNDPSQTWHRVRHYWDLHFPASRYSAPPASVGARPATGTSTGSATSSPASLNPDRARESSVGYRSPVTKNLFRRKLQTRHSAIRVAYGTAGHQFACSDHPGLSESAVGEVCRLAKPLACLLAKPLRGHLFSAGTKPIS